MFGSLITHSYYSFLRGASSPEALAKRATEIGHTALCLTDWYGVYGAVRLQRACQACSIKPIIGCSIQVAQTTAYIIAKDSTGYSSLNSLITKAHRQEQLCLDSWDPLYALEQCYILLYDLHVLPHSFPTTNIVQCLDHQRKPGDTRRARSRFHDAMDRGLSVCVAPDIRYAHPSEYKVYDVLTCTRLGITVFDAHIERPVNDQQCLRSYSELADLLPFPDALYGTSRLLEECSFDILPGYVTPPNANVPCSTSADDLLKELCLQSLPGKYSSKEPIHDSSTCTIPHQPKPPFQPKTIFNRNNISITTACKQLEHELRVIRELGLSDFFLVVKEIIDEATRRGIRHSGRGSAANSIVAYLLGITGVCPLSHHLLFERFLHRGRKGTPDIDVDFDSDRRQEIIDWMEQRFGTQHTAMTATLITYRARMAVRDVAKTLGWPMETVNRLSKAIPGFTNRDINCYRQDLAAIVGDAPLLTTLLHTVMVLVDIPRHLGMHNGGMILSSKPLYQLTPVQRSANGTSVVQFDKDDVEAMGLVKFDVLGLRMLACISEAVELIELNTLQGVVGYNTVRGHLDTLQFNDPCVYDLIRSGNTLGIFQIESQGQMHMLAMHQPDCFNDLITEVALFRPGPLQGGMVHPYIRRRRGLEQVSYIHPTLQPILQDTLGIVLFQEQVLEIAHRFAGMSLDEADSFRALISKNRDAQAMATMRQKFIQGALSNGVDLASAELVYEKVSHFVGYGFCKSHAAAFARIVYQSAWLKTYYPAAYMAAFMQHRPGFYNLMTLEEEARRLGVPILMPDINKSGIRYQLELLDNHVFAIRKPITSIDNVTQDVAHHIVWERASGLFTNTEDLWERTLLRNDVMDSIALSGALDVLEGNSRKALWKCGVIRENMAKKQMQKKQTSLQLRNTGQLKVINTPIAIEDIPELPPIRAQERLAYDYLTHGAARVHPISLYRRSLNELGVLPIIRLQQLSTNTFNHYVAGIVILRQSPPTAHGVLFVTIEDETGFIQCVVEPNEREYFKDQLRNSALIIKGVVHAKSNWRSVVARDIRVLNNVIGGFKGHPMMNGGTDTLETSTKHESTLLVNPDSLPVD